MKYDKLEGDQCWIRRPTGPLESAAAVEARQNRHGVIRLIYSDGFDHLAQSRDKDLHDFDSWFALVSFVQSQQQKGQP